MLTKNRNDVLSMLVTGAGLVDLKQIDQAYASVDRLDTPLHKVLVMLGYISQFKMDRVLCAEAMIRENALSPDMAVKALRLATAQQLTFEAALAHLTEEHRKTQVLPSASNEITDLLLKVGFINKEQIGRAVKVFLETGMQMGRVLVFQKDVSSNVMKAVLTCALMIQDEKITEEAAVQVLNVVKNTGVTIEQAMFEQGVFFEEAGQGPKIGELFAMAGFVSDSDMLECLEIHVLRGRQLGQILIEQGLVDHETMENAVTLQGMMASNSIHAFDAAKALKRAFAKKVSIYQALGELSPPAMPKAQPLTFSEVLVDSHLVDNSVLERLTEGQDLVAVQIAKKILAAGLMTDKICFTALRCWSLNKEGFLTNTDTLDVLKQCVSYNANLDEQLPSWGFFVPNRMQWIWK